ncbi:uncharacterized protein LOC105939363 [Fundulus heteroclitus]|uniref:uncharacterized protein LOC105939363 n=1 Tax=Fundulus heteroclitus TaxID=8078 RepID=UPI00165CC99B|nr:uncharacterized protein LOC105939363 [Fundulus heteroclitus]
MILTARSLCLPSAATVQELFSVARDANIIPDISLDPVLTTFLSLDSSAALQHQYGFLQRSMSGEQQAAFNLNLTAEVGSCRVTYGGVGVIALALSLLLDQVAQHVVRGSAEGLPSPKGSRAERIFGISTSSRIGSMIHTYLSLVPGIANNEEKMAETTELYDNFLNLELIDHYERMTTKKRMSTESMQQWLAGAAFHLHLRIHQVRLRSVPSGSIESLRLSYKTGLNRLVHGYVAYLRKNVLETEAAGPLKAKTGAGSRMENSNSSSISTNVMVYPAHTTPNATAGDNRSCGDSGSGELRGRNGTTLNTSTPRCIMEEEDSELGLLVIEPQRKVSHTIQHHPCESPAIQQALVAHIMKSQDLQRNRNFFLYPEKVLQSLLKQRDDFELKAT